MLKPIKHRRVNITGQGGPRGIYEFGFLPGGRYLMILAEFLTGGVITSWNFHVHTDKAEVTVVLVTRRERSSYWLQVLRVTFSLDDADQLKFEEIITVPVPFDCPAIQIHCDHVWSTGCLGDDELLLFVLLFKDKRHVLINTGIRHFPGQWDSFAHLPRGVMLYREDADSAYSYWYDNVTTFFEEIESTADLDQRITALRPLRHADGSRVYNFAKDCGLRRYTPFCLVAHALGTPLHSHPNAALVSILSISRAEGNRPGASHHEIELAASGANASHRTIAQHWFNTALTGGGTSLACPSEAAEMETDEYSPSLQRWIHHIPTSALDVGTSGMHYPSVGSHGTHILWLRRDLPIHRQTNEQERETCRLSIATLLPTGQASDPEFPSEVVIKDICVESGDTFGLDLERVTTMDMEDSHGIIALAIPSGHDATQDNMDLDYIHLLYL
ncbi:hypothetical protein FRB94_002106 [Tulasnella sp. JGI-2019a]|nr:hypothetical protein FRB94_002106 [Tulasnella sp. JGI-2019a]